MANNLVENPIFQPTERRQFQYDALDLALTALTDPNLSQVERRALEQHVSSLKFIISVQGPDVGEFEY